jgi:hypothetical protein
MTARFYPDFLTFNGSVFRAQVTIPIASGLDQRGWAPPSEIGWPVTSQFEKDAKTIALGGFCAESEAARGITSG